MVNNNPLKFSEDTKTFVTEISALSGIPQNIIKEVMEFMGSEFKYGSNTSYATNKFNYGNVVLTIRTLEGDMKVSEGDYIIKGVKGEFYPCKPDIFQATYDVLENE